MADTHFAQPDLSTAGGLAAQLAQTGATKEAVLAYFRAATVETARRRLLTDEISGEQHKIPDVDLSDGTWHWNNTLPYHVEHHDIRVPDELFAHMRAAGFRPAEN